MPSDVLDMGGWCLCQLRVHSSDTPVWGPCPQLYSCFADVAVLGRRASCLIPFWWMCRTERLCCVIVVTATFV